MWDPMTVIDTDDGGTVVVFVGVHGDIQVRTTETGLRLTPEQADELARVLTAKADLARPRFYRGAGTDA